MGNAKSTLTSITGYAIAPAIVTAGVVALIKSTADPGTTALIVFTILIGIGIGPFLTLFWPDLATSLKKDGNSDIDAGTAGTYIVISLISCVIASGLTQIALRKKK